MIQTDVIESICDNLIQLDSKIRFIGVIDYDGRILVQKQNDKLNVNLSMQDVEVLFTEIALGIRMEKGHDRYFGKENFAISYGSKITSIVFPLHHEFVCVFVSKEADAVKIAFFIFNMLSETRSK